MKSQAQGHLGREERPKRVNVRGAQGSILEGARGRKYIDFFMGWNVGNLGWGNRAIRKKVQSFRGPDYVYPGYQYEPWDELANVLADIAPGKLDKVFRATGGSEAVDLALQASILHTKRRKFLSIDGAYHGNTLGGLSVGSADALKKAAGRSLLPCDHISLPLEPKTLDRVERRLKSRAYAAFIMEPVICNLDVYIPDPDFMAGLGKLCRKYGTLLIMDEVATGFYRTGKLFATEHYDISPDLLCLAKAITGGYGEMGATLMTREVASSMQDRGTFYSTYGWHPLSVEAALADLKVLLKGRRKLEAHIADLSELFHERLREIDFGETPEISIKGLAIGVRFQKKGLGEAIATRARSEGLLVSEGENGFNLFPALTLDRATAEQGMKILERCAHSH